MNSFIRVSQPKESERKKSPEILNIIGIGKHFDSAVGRLKSVVGIGRNSIP